MAWGIMHAIPTLYHEMVDGKLLCEKENESIQLSPVSREASNGRRTKGRKENLPLLAPNLTNHSRETDCSEVYIPATWKQCSENPILTTLTRTMTGDNKYKHDSTTIDKRKSERIYIPFSAIQPSTLEYDGEEIRDLIGDDNWNKFVREISEIGTTNQHLETCYGSCCLPFLCCPCFWFCCYKSAWHHAVGSYERWKPVFEREKVGLSVAYKPGKIDKAYFTLDFMAAPHLYCAVVDVSKAQLHDHLLPVNVEKKIKGNNIPLKSSYGSGSEGELDLP